MYGNIKLTVIKLILQVVRPRLYLILAHMGVQDNVSQGPGVHVLHHHPQLPGSKEASDNMYRVVWD